MDRKQERLIEWACQKLMRRYYYFVDRYEYENAAALFTDDARWQAMGVDLKGREQILEGMHKGLEEGTIRHVLTNTDLDGNGLEIYCESNDARALFQRGRGDQDLRFSFDDPPPPWADSTT